MFGLIPSLDGNVDFQQYFEYFKYASVHPPLKFLLMHIFFSLFGYGSYTWIGVVFFVSGIIAMYKIGRYLWSKKAGIIAAFLLATNGLFLSNALFAQTDFMITVFLLWGFYFYMRDRFWLYAFFLSLAVLTKEPALLFAVSIFLCNFRRLRVQFFIPFFIFGVWTVGLHYFGFLLWNQWNFSTVASRGSLYTIGYNLMTLGIFNKYAYENMLHLFILNWTWVFWGFAVVGISRSKRLFPLALFGGLYILLILTFPTWTIPRYVLSVVPVMILFGVNYLKNKTWVLGLVAGIALISLFSSVDPISGTIFHTRELLGEKFFVNDIDGNDGITYNFQYFIYTYKRDKILRAGNPIECYPVLLGSTDDYKTRRILNFPKPICK